MKKVLMTLKIEFDVLKAQKVILQRLQKAVVTPDWYTLEGIIDLIDAIQDHAVKHGIATKEEVYNMLRENGKPSMDLTQARKIIMEKNTAPSCPQIMTL